MALLTGGGDRPYALGLALSLAAQGVQLDFIGSDLLRSRELEQHPNVRILNLRGSQERDAPFISKVGRILKYYVRLTHYAASSDAEVFHILWNNKFEILDRTLLMLYYRLLGKRVILTVHNVNAAARDGRDTLINRLTLRCQYAFAHHLIVHTDSMRRSLEQEFNVPAEQVTVMPFPVNDTTPDTTLTRADARRQLGIEAEDRVVLFFGNIAPYKGLEYLVRAIQRAAVSIPKLVLVVAGAPKCDGAYWSQLQKELAAAESTTRIVQHISYIADEDTEVYFKAADVVALPYVYIYQSGVLFLAYRYGVPVIATSVGELPSNVDIGTSGFVCAPGDEIALGDTVQKFFSSTLFAEADASRARIRDTMLKRNSWSAAGRLVTAAYGPAFAGGRSRAHLKVV